MKHKVMLTAGPLSHRWLQNGVGYLCHSAIAVCLWISRLEGEWSILCVIVWRSLSFRIDWWGVVARSVQCVICYVCVCICLVLPFVRQPLASTPLVSNGRKVFVPYSGVRVHSPHMPYRVCVCGTELKALLVIVCGESWPITIICRTFIMQNPNLGVVMIVEQTCACYRSILIYQWRIPGRYNRLLLLPHCWSHRSNNK